MVAVQAAIASAVEDVLVDYTTTEQPLGIKWSDGRPVYRAVKEGSAGFNNSNWTQVTFFDDNENRSLKKVTVVTQCGLRVQNTSFTNSLGFSTVTSSGNGASFTGSYVITIEYTKDADPTS
jgi:hypothetical protein